MQFLKFSSLIYQCLLLSARLFLQLLETKEIELVQYLGFNIMLRINADHETTFDFR